MLKDLIKKRILESTGLSEESLNKIIFATKDSLHDPFLYTGMDNLITKLYEFKCEQQKNPHKLLVVDTDYDTDGIMSACVLTAALSVFNINHRVYIPSMHDGYGLNVKAIDEMLETYSDVSLILTADNGTNAYDGVDYAKSKGISVLVTDHHLGNTTTANADALVNPNIPTDFYPFKGNAGATVAWKTMLAYAKKYKPEAESLIYDLIVFAGIANVADVMPITDENHFMVREAIEKLNTIQSGDLMMRTNIPGYDTVMSGLADLLTIMQSLRDAERKDQGKKPSPLPNDEQLISWYISPLLNAPRRVVGTPTTAFKGLLHYDSNVRAQNIKELIEQNKQKSQLRDEALSMVKEEHLQPSSNVVDVPTNHGIAGLVASQLLSNTHKATIVFANHNNWSDETIISGSARSTDSQPLPLIIAEVEKKQPGIIKGGGGHAQAAGYSIRKGDLPTFRALFEECAKEVLAVTLAELTKLPQDTRPLNHVIFTMSEGIVSNQSVCYNIVSDHALSKNILDTLDFFDTLKPFGKDFEIEPQFTLLLSPIDIQYHNYNPDFWKTFKAEINGVEILTFSVDLANRIKSAIRDGNDGLIVCQCELKKNEFLGRIKPQLLLS